MHLSSLFQCHSDTLSQPHLTFFPAVFSFSLNPFTSGVSFFLSRVTFMVAVGYVGLSCTVLYHSYKDSSNSSNLQLLVPLCFTISSLSPVVALSIPFSCASGGGDRGGSSGSGGDTITTRHPLRARNAGCLGAVYRLSHEQSGTPRVPLHAIRS